MKKLLRLLGGLAVATAIAVTWWPRPAAAVSCSTPGHFHQTIALKGYADPDCNDSDPATQYCTVGALWVEWDCVTNPNGTLSVANFRQVAGPEMCWQTCHQGGGGVWQQVKCCNGL